MIISYQKKVFQNVILNIVWLLIALITIFDFTLNKTSF